jgi:hypothetical protein
VRSGVIVVQSSQNELSSQFLRQERNWVSGGQAVLDASGADRGHLPDELENIAEWMTSMCTVILHYMRLLGGRQKKTVLICRRLRECIRGSVHFEDLN